MIRAGINPQGWSPFQFIALRLLAVGGDLTATQIRSVAAIAEKYGTGRIHIFTRQGIEIHNVKTEDLESAQVELEAAGLTMGASGNRVRLVTACPGKNTCRFGSIDTQSIAAKLDERCFRMETPYKVKIGVTGCPDNCGKAREADIGIMGSRIPRWNGAECNACDACITYCVAGAIRNEEGRYLCDEDKCIRCSACTGRCQQGAWQVDSFGYTVLIGGTLGKRPRPGIPQAEHLATEVEALELVDKTMKFYKKHGQPRERLGHLMERLGEENVKREILHSV